MTDTPDDPLAGLDFEVTEPVVIDLTLLTDFELTELRTNVHEALRKSHELWTPRETWSEAAKELHSTFTAIQIEQHRRRSS